MNQILLVENFLWLQNHFPGSRIEPKIFIQMFWSKIFQGCKIISSKTGLNKKFSKKKCFGRKFLLLQNHFLENRFEPNIFIKNCLVKMFYGCKIISSKTGLKEKYFPRSYLRKIFWTKNFYVCKIISLITGLK